MASYLRPRDLDEALRALGDGPRTVLAGGTDYYPARVGRPLDEAILDISGIDALLHIEEDEAGWRIPARCTWSALLATDLPPLFDGLKAAAREIGGELRAQAELRLDGEHAFIPVRRLHPHEQLRTLVGGLAVGGAGSRPAGRETAGERGQRSGEEPDL